MTHNKNLNILLNLLLLAILFYHAYSLFFLIIDLYFLIAAVITNIFNPIVEFAIPIGIPTKEAQVEMETHPVIVEITISECSI